MITVLLNLLFAYLPPSRGLTARDFLFTPIPTLFTLM